MNNPLVVELARLVLLFTAVGVLFGVARSVEIFSTDTDTDTDTNTNTEGDGVDGVEVVA